MIRKDVLKWEPEEIKVIRKDKEISLLDKIDLINKEIKKITEEISSQLSTLEEQLVNSSEDEDLVIYLGLQSAITIRDCMLSKC